MQALAHDGGKWAPGKAPSGRGFWWVRCVMPRAGHKGRALIIGADRPVLAEVIGPLEFMGSTELQMSVPGSAGFSPMSWFRFTMGGSARVLRPEPARGRWLPMSRKR